MTALVLAISAGLGCYFVLTRDQRSASKPYNFTEQTIRKLLVLAGLADADPRHLATLGIAVFIGGSFLGWAMFGGILTALVLGLFCVTFPFEALRRQRERRLETAADMWPKLIDEIRLRCGSLGQPIPHALFEVGKAGPQEYRVAFVMAEREWLISTDFARAVTVLKRRLDDATADIVCETLLVANSLGGNDIEHRLLTLVEDRRSDSSGRKDARSKQSGVQFARKFVLIVPVGMALVGISIGQGREAYASSTGQVGVTVALVTLAACWWWAGRLIKLPAEKRVLHG